MGREEDALMPKRVARWIVARWVIMLVFMLPSLAYADCLDFASTRGFLPLRADGWPGQLILTDTSNKEESALYVNLNSKWCFLPLKMASKMCEIVEHLPRARTLLQAHHATLMALHAIGYVCQVQQGEADH